MPREIIKCEPGRDLYMEWSSVVDAPTFIGTRADLAGYLTSDEAGRDRQMPEAVERRLGRADDKGSSALHEAGCFWDAPGEIYMQQGWLPRSRFVALAERYLATDVPNVNDLLDTINGSSR